MDRKIMQDVSTKTMLSEAEYQEIHAVSANQNVPEADALASAFPAWDLVPAVSFIRRVK